MSTVTAVPIAPIKRAYVLWLWLGLAFALVAGVALAKVGSTGIQTTPSGLRYKVMKQGTGPHPTDSDVALVRYEGRLMNGTVFDKSEQPTPLPVARMIPGFTEGLKLMSKGAKYRFWIKPELAYGAEDKGPIPANSTLQFDVELIEFMSEAQIRAMQQMMMQQQGGMPGGTAVPGGEPQGR
ncbi:FKBP-type peptidyl-prolyl cis-trans isomerase [uncultured Sphingomonas sp.]|uniref:FKBP-type peptidyl-prolyl cis-trans isomerase n=1 Tax=uncultured Sphingomonas sp. TaxID=158754 RepID=UPI00261253B9|nr:FKBP-type peptidyl-prolyl cis-trans isomerase [uncultured Sphingomonas sp.]